YCGVYGLKPTHGLVSRGGMFQLSRSLDHVGLFARTIEDLALLLEVVAGHDPGDPDTRPRPRVATQAVGAEAPPTPPRLGFVKTPRWGDMDDDAREAFGELADALGDGIEEIELLADEAPEWHRLTMDVELAITLAREWEHGRDRLSASLRTRIESGHAARAYDYLRARAAVPVLLAGGTARVQQPMCAP